MQKAINILFLELPRELMHRLLALVFLTLALPVILLFYFLMKVVYRQKESFFYSGPRLGKNKKVFAIYKIRTLPENATATLSQEMYRPGIELELKCGNTLRKSRLDELPQLWNVIKGDMALVGPRPVRPQIYEKYHARIRRYDQRFQIKPGITGYSQLLTAARTPKRIRSVIDNYFVRHRANLFWDLLLLGKTALIMSRYNFFLMLNAIVHRLRIHAAHGHFSDLRALPRVDGRDVEYCLADDRFRPASNSWRPTYDLNYYAIALPADLDFKPDVCLTFVLRKNVQARRGLRRAKCHGLIYRKTENHKPYGRFRYVILYTPASDYSRYVIDQYMLHESIG